MCWNKRNAPDYAYGFTLIEVLVALTVLAAGIIGIMAALSLCTHKVSESLRLAEVATIAQSQMELAVIAPAGTLEAKAGSAGLYQWEVTFGEKPYGLVLALVVVKWTLRGEPKMFRLSRVFAPGR